jgi:uncharacterized protein (UPF0548 family)
MTPQPHPGDVALGPTPEGHRYFRRSIPLAHAFGPDDAAADRAFERARAMLRAWGPQIGAGMSIEGETSEALGVLPAPEVGLEGRLNARIAGVIPLHAPFRIVAADFDSADYAGFAYETLPGHPEHGREAFYVTREDGRVEFTVMAFSRPAAWYSRLGGPVTRMLQNRYTNKYLLAMAVRPK